jgi:hypothetical protein
VVDSVAKRKQSQKERILCGYEKLAFGSVADAVRLLFSDEPDLNALESMDLFNIAEIKRPKGGGMEIKFFDRIKALQCMEEMDSSTENGQAGFYRALQNGVRALEQQKHELENPDEED